MTFELGTKSVYNSTCELLEHFQEKLRKLPEMCKDVYWNIMHGYFRFMDISHFKGTLLPSSEVK